MSDHWPACRRNDPGWIGDCNCAADPVGGTPDAAVEARERLKLAAEAEREGPVRFVIAADLLALIAGYDAQAERIKTLERMRAERRDARDTTRDELRERIKTLEADVKDAHLACAEVSKFAESQRAALVALQNAILSRHIPMRYAWDCEGFDPNACWKCRDDWPCEDVLAAGVDDNPIAGGIDHETPADTESTDVIADHDTGRQHLEDLRDHAHSGLLRETAADVIAERDGEGT
jgi:hypothetical protein